MNGVKGKFLKKLKSIKPIPHFAPDAFTDYFSRNENFQHSSQKIKIQKFHEIDEDEETGFDNKENIVPTNKSNGFVEQRNGSEISECLELEMRQSSAQTPLSEIDISSFRPPDMNAGSLFDPNLLAVFHQAVMEHMKMREEEIKCRYKDEITEMPHEDEDEDEEQEEEEENILFGFRENCPPGGSDSVILYTTTLRGIRKTFEDCNRVRFLLETFRVKFQERDISMHLEFREELWRVLESKASPPKLFIRGRYIGGAEEVLGLHEQGKLRPLFSGVPIDPFAGSPCEGCGGVRFVVCFNCNGSQKVVLENEESSKCPECNENGLILCPYCC